MRGDAAVLGNENGLNAPAGIGKGGIDKAGGLTRLLTHAWAGLPAPDFHSSRGSSS